MRSRQAYCSRRVLIDTCTVQPAAGACFCATLCGKVLLAAHLSLLGMPLFEGIDQPLLHHGQCKVHEQQERVVACRLLPKGHLDLPLEDQDCAVGQSLAGQLRRLSMPHAFIIPVVQLTITSLSHPYNTPLSPPSTYQLYIGQSLLGPSHHAAGLAAAS